VDNLEFASELEPDNTAVRDRLAAMRRRLARGEPSVPSTIDEERQTNPFLRADDADMARAVNMAGAPPAQVFAELRRRKDAW
jgi:hydroxyacylglutathione hydrolase